MYTGQVRKTVYAETRSRGNAAEVRTYRENILSLL